VGLSFDPAYDDGPLLAASRALENGDWQPAMWLLQQTGRDWDRKAHRVKRLGHDPSVLHTVAAWADAQPGNPDAYMVLGQTLVGAAWAIRGSSYASGVSEDAWRPFFQYLKDADDVLVRAIDMAPYDPTPWVVTLLTARGRQVSRAEFQSRWKGLVERDRFNVLGHQHALQYLCKKWLGSHEEMFAFAESASASAPQGSPLHVLPVYAATEYALELFDKGTIGVEYLRYKKGDQVKSALHRAVTCWEEPARASGMPPHALAVFDRTHTAFGAGTSGDRALAARQYRAMGPYSAEYPWAYFAPNPRRTAEINRHLARIIRF